MKPTGGCRFHTHYNFYIFKLIISLRNLLTFNYPVLMRDIKDINLALSSTLRKIRLGQQCSRKQLANALNRSISYIARIERNETGIHVATVYNLCYAMGIQDPYYLMYVFNGEINKIAPRPYALYNENEADTFQRSLITQPLNDSVINIALGSILRNIRVNNNLKREFIAKKISCSKSFIDKVEQGTTSIRFAQLHRICFAIKIYDASEFIPQFAKALTIDEEIK